VFVVVLWPVLIDNSLSVSVSSSLKNLFLFSPPGYFPPLDNWHTQKQNKTKDKRKNENEKHKTYFFSRLPAPVSRNPLANGLLSIFNCVICSKQERRRK